MIGDGPMSSDPTRTARHWPANERCRTTVDRSGGYALQDDLFCRHEHPGHYRQEGGPARQMRNVDS
jgi:hypothetical protein